MMSMKSVAGPVAVRSTRKRFADNLGTLNWRKAYLVNEAVKNMGFMIHWKYHHGRGSNEGYFRFQLEFRSFCGLLVVLYS